MKHRIPPGVASRTGTGLWFGEKRSIAVDSPGSGGPAAIEKRSFSAPKAVSFLAGRPSLVWTPAWFPLPGALVPSSILPSSRCEAISQIQGLRQDGLMVTLP
jgi:hypothetical protein